ncbi:MAG: hypothetical protein L3J39_11030 [Verrucomicrobiales bacterium]|nr:hypothetical protein [Verrucomicrobiales bacterium]
MQYQIEEKSWQGNKLNPREMNRRIFIRGSLAGAGALALSSASLSQSWGADLKHKKARRVLIDTDANNEMDDQYAIVRALIAPELKVEAITSAGYHDRKQGAQRSLDELNRVLELMGLTGEIPVALGSPGPMKDKLSPLTSAASQMIIDHAMRDDPDPLYVERSVIKERLSRQGAVYDYLVSLWETERFKAHKGKILWDLALIHAMIDPALGQRVTVPAPRVLDDGNTEDFTSNSRQVEVYANIDADEIYKSFWAAVKLHKEQAKR